MKKYRILLFILIFEFALSVTSCSLGNLYATPPQLHEEFRTDYGEDIINEVLPFGTGYICLLNSNQIIAYDSSGNELDQYTFEIKVTQIRAAEEILIMALLEDNEMVCLSFDKYSNDFHVVSKTNVEFDIKDFSCLSAYNETFLVVSEDNILYGYGLNFRGCINSKLPETDIIVEPVPICEDVQLIHGFYAVTTDNWMFHVTDQTKLCKIDSPIEGISDYSDMFIYTHDEIYDYNFHDNILTKITDIDDSMVYSCQANYLYMRDGELFFTGEINVPNHGKGISEVDNCLVTMDIKNNVVSVFRGAITYDEHSLVFYQCY
ncbi:MAG: hypothetical protein MJ108_08140 [Saccharofermentans sp.]|nr:hypothetical protein [Saccharofermentans sp.]